MLTCCGLGCMREGGTSASHVFHGSYKSDVKPATEKDPKVHYPIDKKVP